MRKAAIVRRADIIAGQVGAEKNKKKRMKMEAEANKFCDLLDDPTFWKNLQTVADDIEPICYITNINQGEKTRADQVLLGFAGVFLHFRRHPDSRVADGMTKRLEKRWAAMDQDFFVIAMVLNPYERISRFGDQAGVSIFTLRIVLMEVRLFNCRCQLSSNFPELSFTAALNHVPRGAHSPLNNRLSSMPTRPERKGK